LCSVSPREDLQVTERSDILIVDPVAGTGDRLARELRERGHAVRATSTVDGHLRVLDLEETIDHLRETEAFRDGLTHMIIHDLRAPLTGIVGHLAVLRMEGRERLGPALAESLDQAYENSAILMNIIDELLGVHCLEAGRLDLDVQGWDLLALVREATASLGSLTRGREVRVQAPGPEVPVACDASLLRRVLTNLLSNALKFSPDGSDVALEVGLDATTVRVTVQDQGPGIPEAYRERIFEKFGQVEARSRGTKRSTGLGLTFCRLAIEAHGGRIGVHCPEGSGSCFWFEMPRRTGVATSETPASP
jgi:K+-sensing histidine kinase KdpD